MSETRRCAVCLSALASATFVGMLACDTQTGATSGVLDARPDAGAGVRDVQPDTASPGLTVRVECDRPVFTRDSKAVVEIGGHAARIMRVMDESSVEVMVPLIPPRTVPVAIIEPHKTAGESARLKVLPAESRRLLLAFAQGAVRLLDNQPQSGNAIRSLDEGGRRIQFEVYNSRGRLLFRDVVNHPIDGRKEVFDHADESGRHIHRVSSRSVAAAFSIAIPSAPDRLTLRFYDVPADADLATPAGERLRVLINDVEVDS